MTILRALGCGLTLALASCVTPTIDRSGAHDLVEQQHALLLDVRSRDEYAERHLEGALNIPVGELEGRLAELEDRKAGPIVVYCRSGRRSERAMNLLRAHGFTRVENLGGIKNW